MNRTRALWKASSIAFLSSFCVMVIELIAGRIMAPYVGNSLYTWTSVIGIILAGIALGNFTGGRIADRWAKPSILALVFIVGGLLTVAIGPVVSAVNHSAWFDSIQVLFSLVLRIFCVFFLPAFVLSMVSPLVIKLTLMDLGQTGGTVGTIYAVSTVGSIVGTFLTGFFLISWFGTRTIVWIVSGILIATGILAWFLWAVPRRWQISKAKVLLGCLVAVTLVGYGVLYQFRDSWEDKYTRESNYFAIRVIEEGSNRRVLKLDHLSHSYVVLNNPTYLRWEYAKTMAEVINYICKDTPNPKVLHLGGGAYTLPKYLDVLYPGSQNDVVEIDPAVTEVAHQYLGLWDSEGITTYNEDGRTFLQSNKPQAKYDIVIGDAFNDLSAPFHLTTLEFDRVVKDHMAPDGIYLVNVIDDPREGRCVPSFVATLQACFKNVFLIGTNGEASWSSEIPLNFVIIATDRDFNIGEYERNLSDLSGGKTQSSFLDQSSINRLLKERQAIVLTDDHAPVEQLIAPLFFKE
jgi:spermidine synthase